MLIPHTSAPLWPPNIAPGRFAFGLKRDDPAGCRVALLGMPDELGVTLNQGRPGASQGPNAIRTALAKYGVEHPRGWNWPAVFDAGDIQPAPGDDAAALHQTHAQVTAAVRAILELGMFPIGLGGGHDLTFPFARAVILHHRQRGIRVDDCVYFDAHLDVRPTPGSGMPFRALVEECDLATLHAFGAQPMVNSREHHLWFQEHGGLIADPLTNPATWNPQRPYVASFDMDVLDAGQVCGVSALNPSGWPVYHAEAWVDRLARDPLCLCFDLMELSPPNDPSGRSARVAAHLLLTFLRGFAARGTP